MLFVNCIFVAHNREIVAMSTFRKRTYACNPKIAPGFSVRSIGHFQLSPPDHEARRFFDFGEIFWCVHGKGVFRLDGKEFILNPDFVWYYPPGSFHDYDPFEAEFQYFWLTVDGPGVAFLFDGLGILPGLNYGGSCPVHLFSRIAQLLPVTRQEAGFEVLSAAFEIFCKIPAARQPGDEQPSPAEAARKIIDSQFTDPSFNVEELAARLACHRSTVSRNFSQKWNISVSDYIINCRLQYAMILLKETNTPIREVALESGFSSAAYFSRVFTARTGTTPAAFRRAT